MTVTHSNTRIPRVAILMGCRQGETYLSQQLDSIESQTHTQWTLWASDDGSTDRTQDILREYQHRWGEDRLQVLQGPRRGFQANFLSLTCHPRIDADYYAYADQDDIWERDKLARALNALRRLPDDIPTMYCARTRLIDAEGRPIGLSWLFTRPPGFRNALVQSLGGGNTMLMNRSTVALMRRIGQNIDIVNHDWWTYLVVTGCGGQVVYDPHPALLYRQHGQNAVGANLGALARLQRARQLIGGRLRDWNDKNLPALCAIRELLTPDSLRTLEEYRRSRQGWLPARAWHLLRSGVYRQHFTGNAGLITALLCNRL